METDARAWALAVPLVVAVTVVPLANAQPALLRSTFASTGSVPGEATLVLGDPISGRSTGTAFEWWHGFLGPWTLATTSVGDPHATGEASLALAGANPCASICRIEFLAPAHARISLAVYDLAGRRVRTLAPPHIDADLNVVEWRLDSDRGPRVPPGLYFVRLVFASTRLTRRVVVLS